MFQHGTPPCHILPLWEELRGARALGTTVIIWKASVQWPGQPCQRARPVPLFDDALCCALNSHSAECIVTFPPAIKKPVSTLTSVYTSNTVIKWSPSTKECNVPLKWTPRAPRTRLTPKLCYKCLHIIFLLEKLRWQTVTFLFGCARLTFPFVNTAHSQINPTLQQHKQQQRVQIHLLTGRCKHTEFFPWCQAIFQGKEFVSRKSSPPLYLQSFRTGNPVSSRFDKCFFFIRLH